MKPREIREIKALSECECGRKNEVLIEDHGYSQLEAKLRIAVEALEHYQTAHYTLSGVTCAHDKSAEDALKKIRGGQ